MTLTPPTPPPLWNHTVEDIGRLTKEFVDKNRAVHDKVGALSVKDCGFVSVRTILFLQGLHHDHSRRLGVRECDRILEVTIKA